MTLLQKSILSTVVYYNTLDYPLTSFEVFKYLINPLHIASFYYSSKKTLKDFSKTPLEINRFSEITLDNIIRNLENRELKKFIKEKNGFYFLEGREKNIRIRIKRQKIADQKWGKVRKIIYWLQIIPYLQMVAVNGSLALNNTYEESDLDLFIVVKNKRIWVTRFLITLFVQLIGKRRHKKLTKDRICLNHYVTDKSLEIFGSLPNAEVHARMIPVLEVKKGIYREFQKANNWIKNYLVFWPKLEIKHSKNLKISSLLRDIAKIFEKCLNSKIGDLLEKLLKKIQERTIEKNPLTHKKGGRIIFNNNQLEFHPNSPEGKRLNKYNKTMIFLGQNKLGQEKDSGLL